MRNRRVTLPARISPQMRGSRQISEAISEAIWVKAAVFSGSIPQSNSTKPNDDQSIHTLLCRYGLCVVEILHKQDLVLRFVIQKLVGTGLCHQDSKSTWANSLFFANGHMGYGVRFRLADCCMREFLE